MQQHSSKYFTHISPQPHDSRGWGQKVKIFLYRSWSCCISNDRESPIQQDKPYILLADPLVLRDLVNRSKSTFSEHGHVAYHIKEITK